MLWFLKYYVNQSFVVGWLDLSTRSNIYFVGNVVKTNFTTCTPGLIRCCSRHNFIDPSYMLQKGNINLQKFVSTVSAEDVWIVHFDFWVDIRAFDQVQFKFETQNKKGQNWSSNMIIYMKVHNLMYQFFLPTLIYQHSFSHWVIYSLLQCDL